MITAGVKVQIPKGFDLDRVGEELTRGLHKSAKGMKQEMESFVEDWDHKPRIGWKSERHSDSFEIHLFPTGDEAKYWIWVSLGTKGTTIRPIHKKALRFPYKGPGVSYAPKTAPMGFRGGAGKKLGKMSYFKAVKWPGITARNFEKETILAQWKSFCDTMRGALDKGLRRAGG